jgi:Spy/CpxP family protein refolding chaperone
MRKKLFAIALGAVVLFGFSIACRAQRAAPGKWIHRTLANAAANEAAQRAREIPPGRWWHLPYFATQLNITDQQKAQLDKLFDYNRNRLMQLKMQIEQERVELVAAIDREHLDERAAISRMKKLEDSRTLLAATRFTYSLEVRKLLGYERFARLKTLFRNWRGLQEYISNKPGVNQVIGAQPAAAQPPGK